MYELTHHGVKGMKWGVRRFQNRDGSLTVDGKKRNLQVSDSDSAITKRVKKDYNTMSDREFMNKYSTSKKTYAKRVDKYGDPHTHAIERNKKIQKGAKVVRKLMITSLADDVLYGGAGKKAVKNTVKYTGRAAVSAYMKARGGYDIRWYDN